jgi:uncharacterized membrane protein YdjX (TVP38/TMEM64 family)
LRRPLLQLLLLLLVVAMLVWAVASYLSGGFVALVMSGDSGDAHQGTWVQQVRDVVNQWGPLAPVIYTAIVVVEVVVAPIPGPLLYAPAGAIFGAWMGGTLSLIGNVIGAASACVLGGMLGERFARRAGDGSKLSRYREQLKARGLWLVLLLRANPMTSSDLVSYAAGLAGVPVWKVAVGTLVGMAPLCYLQAYFAQRIFEVLPGPVLAASTLLVVAIVLIMALRARETRKAERT